MLFPVIMSEWAFGDIPDLKPGEKADRNLEGDEKALLLLLLSMPLAGENDIFPSRCCPGENARPFGVPGVGFEGVDGASLSCSTVSMSGFRPSVPNSCC